MAAGDRIYTLRYAKHPTAAIAGVRQATVRPGTVARQDPGAAGATGLAEQLVTYRTVDVELAARMVAYSLKSATHGVTTIDGALHARVTPSSVFRVDPGAAGAPGPAEALVTYYGVGVEVYSLDYSELLDLVGATAASLALGYEGAAGADQTLTLADVYFAGVPSQIEMPAPDTGGTITAFGIAGQVQFDAAEVFADVVTGDLDDFENLLAKVGAAAANLVLGTEGEAGANEKVTLKNVHFVEPTGTLELASPDIGGPVPSGIGLHGLCEWGAADTFATMITAAAEV